MKTPEKKITWDDVLEEFEKQFPKGHCEERGQAIVVLAFARMAYDKHEEKLKQIRDLVLDDVPHQYQTRLLEVLIEK